MSSGGCEEEEDLIRRAREFRKQKRYTEGVKLLQEGLEQNNPYCWFEFYCIYRMGGWGIARDDFKAEYFKEKIRQSEHVFVNKDLIELLTTSELSVFCTKFNFFYEMCMENHNILHSENAMTLCSSVFLYNVRFYNTVRTRPILSTLRRIDMLYFRGRLSNCANLSSVLSLKTKNISLLRECAFGQRHYMACECLAKTSDELTKTLLYLLSENTDALRLKLEPKEDSDERLRELYLIGGYMHQNRHLRDVLHKPNNDAIKSFNIYLEYTTRIRKAVLCWMNCAKCLGFYKDVSKMIGKFVWSSRFQTEIWRIDRIHPPKWKR